MTEEKTYVHAEAFCLMRFRCESCRFAETLWNSRDGVTPFIINCQRCGGSMQHEDWARDKRIVDFQPLPGMRIFVDLSKEKYREWWDKQLADGKFPMTMSGDEKFEEAWADVNSHGEPSPDIQVVPRRRYGGRFA